MQLNFLSGYENHQIKLEKTQAQFWDTNFNIISPPKRTPEYSKVEKFFLYLDYTKVQQYKEYWQQVAPDNDSEVFQRWLFAFMSVHTSWKSNIAGYQAIKDWWAWLNKSEDLLDKLEKSRVGMQFNRVKFINEFAQKFWQNPSGYKKSSAETWVSYRDRIKENTLGLGSAKTSFAIEMCYPNKAKIVCLDTHMFQAYGLDQTRDARYYKDIEQHWVDMCIMWNVPSYIARCLYWDDKQGYNDSRYWSHVLEK
jgi:thermostable 8-oxoguanine DNA glycosylase